METMSGRFGAQVRQARTRKGWTQKELAAHAGINPRTVAKIEKGDGGVWPSKLKQIADLLKIPPEMMRVDMPSEIITTTRAIESWLLGIEQPRRDHLIALIMAAMKAESEEHEAKAPREEGDPS